MSDETLYKLFVNYVLDPIDHVRIYRMGGGRVPFLHRGRKEVQAKVPRPR